MNYSWKRHNPTTKDFIDPAIKWAKKKKNFHHIRCGVRADRGAVRYSYGYSFLLYNINVNESEIENFKRNEALWELDFGQADWYL